MHGYHERTATDVPADGRRVVLKVRARRMRCPVTGCEVQTFREQVPGVLERYQPRTTRLVGQVSAVARELAGRASARLLPALGTAVSRHTALRALLRIPLPALGVPRVLGIDLSRSRDYPDRRSGGSRSRWCGPLRMVPGTRVGGVITGFSRNASRLSGGR